MDVRTALPGLEQLQRETPGDPDICLAVLDGPVDLSHPCFSGADLQQLNTLVQEAAGQGPMSAHGTHVASLLFGQPGSAVHGIAPACKGLIVPIFRDAQSTRTSQLDLARAIEQAAQAGANIISVSGGERAHNGEPDAVLAHALQLCDDNDILVVAAVGNDGCECLQVPAAVPPVLAVGAVDASGEPLESSNWSEVYRTNGVTAPGQDIDGAAPGGGTTSLTGSSFATPIVSGVAALLLALQRQFGIPADPREIRRVILATADPGKGKSAQSPRLLAGALDIPGILNMIKKEGMNAVASTDMTAAPHETVRSSAASPNRNALDAGEGVRAAASPNGAEEPTPIGLSSDHNLADAAAGESVNASASPPGIDEAEVAHPAGYANASTPTHGSPHSSVPSMGTAEPRGVGPRAGVMAAGDCGCSTPPGTAQFYVYAIGTVGWDFGTEARRDSFRQQMPPVSTFRPAPDGSPPEVSHSAPANPYDPFQMRDYLRTEPWASNKLIWTLNLERTPIYALEAEVPFGMQWGEPIIDDTTGQVVGANLAYPPVSLIYKTFRDAIAGQALPDTDPGFISRVSVPGKLTNRTIRLFSGQIVPVVEVSSRGTHTWNERALVDSAVDAVQTDISVRAQRGERTPTIEDEMLRQMIRAFLDKVYYQFRNLGQTPADRALNFAATNAFMVTNEIREGLLSGSYVPGPHEGLYSLDTISVSKSPYCRMDSDCWDVHVTFFYPEDENRARVTYLFTIDVSDELPVSLAPSHRFLVGSPKYVIPVR